ncbi:hypothetical protein QR685DRAFT_518981 [Neurospora intermedia]|uniref:Zn(2)-C6 fungal-type domain-containing protein n=1 Tax=Neurospora intermedia TaxID=5142 RepID=A0ABR3DF90_NEUIN
MKTTRYSTSRQKSCQPCSNAKAKCDRKATSCSRCALRGLACTYSQASLSGGSRLSLDSTPEPNVAIAPATTQKTSSLAGESTTCIQPGVTSLDGLVSPASTTNLAEDTSRSAHHQRQHQVTSHTTRGGGSAALQIDFKFSHVDLVCPINANDIQNRWLKPYIEVAVLLEQTAKTLSPSITAFTDRILKSYAAIAVRGGGGHRGSIPPFLHPVHVLHTLPNTPPLATCLSLIRSCEKPLPGSEGVLVEVLQREMNKFYEQYGHNNTCDDDDDDDSAAQLLAAFQAYLVYTLVLHYRLGKYAFLRQQAIMMHLQELACACSARGLVCSAEQDGGAQGSRPRWETWIVAETKRRTLYTMYLLDNMLTAKEGLPTFLGTELRGLPAPAGKALWQASARDEWEKAYNLHLAEWYPEGGGLCIDELWAIPADMDEAGVVERRRRVDRWLEGVDEFGMMMYAVTSCTHGG